MWLDCARLNPGPFFRTDMVEEDFVCPYFQFLWK
ncbi:hypothetical protein JOF54_002526 [Microlunatus capsulatus]|uniref:Uncharacterized protein n=1 Tax=Microlunatus capsulatus TaxID=99117 RepID=A0ABS4Z9D8_9ACTN|nr:hypothetical protein [Microlunatus capsulatus]